MTDKSKFSSVTGHGRRDFLKAMVLAAPVAAVTAVGAEAKQMEPEVDTTAVRLQDTAHTRAYFDSAGF